MILIAKNAFTLQWTLVDTANAPINDANVTATLYQGRSGINPDSDPGVAVPPLDNITLVYVPASAGVYQAAEPATLNPTPNTDGSFPSFTLVIDASLSGNPTYHHEEPLIVQTAIEADAVDLTTLDAVKDEAGVSSTSQDNIIQGYITAFSKAVLNETSIVSFSQPVTMHEVRNGNGNFQLFTRMSPIINVAVVNVNGRAVPAAGAWPTGGYFIGDDRKSIWIRQTGGFGAYRGAGFNNARFAPGCGFTQGIGNVELGYTAGYLNVPSDLEIAARKAVAIFYKRKQTIDQASKGIISGGTTATTRYRDWKVPPEVASVIDFYSRTAIV